MTDQSLDYHKKLVDDAVRFRSPDRIPFIPHFYLWSTLDAGYKISEACTDWDLNVAIQKRFHETYKFDVFKLQSGLLCNPRNMLTGVGKGFNVFNDEAESIEIDDFRLFNDDEYDRFLADRKTYLWEVMLPRKFERWNSLTVGDLVEPLAEYRRFNDHLARLNVMAVDELHLPRMNAAGPPALPVECLYMYWMGIQGASIDARRHPEKFGDVVSLLDAEFVDPFVASLKAGAVDSSQCAFDVSFTLLAQNFMSPKQFGRYYWPSLKKIIDAAVEQDRTVHMFAEGMISRLGDFFADVPKGHMAIQIEQEDPANMRKVLPNITTMGGMTTHYLGNVSTEECLAYARRLLEDMQGDGGFILAPDKMMSYRRDARPENLKAVCDMVAEYDKQGVTQ